MSIAGNQRRILRRMLEELRPHWRRDAALPERIERLLRGDRRLGSRDRRLYRELIYAALRYLPWVEPLLDSDPDRAEAAIAWLAADTPATRAFRAETAAGLPPCPEGVEAKAGILGTDPDAVLPPWLRSECPGAFATEQRDALCARSPLWIRLAAIDSAPVREEFATRGWPVAPSSLLARAWSVATEADLTATDSFRLGRFEIQDIGSQAILESAGLEPGGRWLDACAGAGGKTLQLAGLLGPTGRVDAHDIRPQALAELLVRARRAGLLQKVERADPSALLDSVAPHRIEVPSTLADTYDGVLVDAPCSGSGTWRRQPHLKWTTRPEDIAAQAERQRRLLAEYSTRVRPGGRLIYATCSLCRSENEAVVEEFLATHPSFSAFAPEGATARFGEPRPTEGLRIWPATLNGDGFFAANLRRRS